MICDQVTTLSLFCDQQSLHKVEYILKDPEHALCGEFESLHRGHWSDRWHTKPMVEDILLFPLLFNSSTGPDQPSKPVLTILYGFTGISVSLGLSGVCMGPAMSECVWLMTAVVCLCRLGVNIVLI